MLLDGESQRPWPEEEVEREMGCDVSKLFAAGLIHRSRAPCGQPAPQVAADRVTVIDSCSG
jgi:hypothetical protein